MTDLHDGLPPLNPTSPPPPRLPRGFVFGAATSAYQIEGGANADGKSDSIWDVFCRLPGAVAGGDSGEVACDHYHRLDDDLATMSALGLDAYRFSIAWPRVMPDGRTLNPNGLDFYERLVDGLLEREIDPWPTLYHWDLPQTLQDEGGWADRGIVERFSDYAAAVDDRLGDRIHRYTTFNEPWVAAFLGHAAGVHAPGHQNPSEAIAAGHHMLLAHGTAVARLRARATAPELGITLNLSVIDPLTPVDEPAARLIDGQMNRFFLDPLFNGAYPEDVREALSPWWPDGLVRAGDLDLISARLDFFGANYYRGEVVSFTPPDADDTIRPATDRPPATPYPASRGIHFHTVLPERTALGWVVQPEGLERLLRRLSDDYTARRGTPIYVTENGAAYHDGVVAGRVHDAARVRFIDAHLRAVAAAVDGGVDVRGYFYWSLLDNFEWDWGYGQRFGIVHVDYETQKRTIKDSGLHYARVIAEHRAT
ncbi:GH1 family beta-glucosidase [Herbiconiux solani]|uniref:GH1 family beta-glucosidase n=1 Tax=Herbiconiux solani TaxID=661329 RepID=UPI000A011CBA|nr:GH1 family beta-glucosidase [Herbiconiux solani]